MAKIIVPYGSRILVRRKKISETKGKSAILLPDDVQARLTDLAVVVYVPEVSFADETLIHHSDIIINNLVKKAEEGSSEALKALLEFNYYLKIKSLQPEMTVFISKYCGTDFTPTGELETLTLCNADDIMGIVKEID
jgi:co-chaperonin GroES (HSP10)